MLTTSTLEERAQARKHPFGFVSAQHPFYTDPKPDPEPDHEPVPEPVGSAHPLEVVEALFEFSTLFGCAAAEGQRRAKARWTEITKARRQPPARE